MVTSLVLANLSSATRVPDAAFKKAMSGDGSSGELADYPISLIITNNTLVQQWHGKRPPHLALTATAAAHTTLATLTAACILHVQTRSSNSLPASRC